MTRGAWSLEREECLSSQRGHVRNLIRIQVQGPALPRPVLSALLDHPPEPRQRITVVTCWSPSGSHHRSSPGRLSQWFPFLHTCPPPGSVARAAGLMQVYSARPLPVCTALSVNPDLIACGSHFLAPQNVPRSPAAWASPGSFQKCRILGPAPDRLIGRCVLPRSIGVHVTACKALRWVGSSRGLEAILFHSRLHPGPKCGPQGTVTLSDLGRGDTRIHGRMGVEVSFSKDREGWVFSTRFLFLKAVRRRGERYEMVGLVLLNRMRLMAHKKGTPLARFQFAVWGQQEAVSPARGEVSEGWGPVCPSDTSDLPPGPGLGPLSPSVQRHSQERTRPGPELSTRPQAGRGLGGRPPTVPPSGSAVSLDRLTRR